MRVVLVDDEKLALQYLESMLNKLENIEVVAKYTDPIKALAEIPDLKIDVVFLDMEMGKMHGLEFAEQILQTHSQIEILFVTAYPQYALEAFEVNALDYLLKPIRIDRLRQAVQKVEEKIALYKIKHETIKQQKRNLTVKAFGCFRLYSMEGEIVKWRTRKAKELFAYLWHHKLHPVHKERVIDEIWPNTDVGRATTLLHTTVYQLRQTCKKLGLLAPVKYANDQYVLTIELESDLDVLKGLLAEEITIETIEQVLDLYVGHYFAEDGYPWALSYQQHIIDSLLLFLERALKILPAAGPNLLIAERIMEKQYELNPTNEIYIIQLANLYRNEGKFEQLQLLQQSITDTYQNELKIAIPDEVASLID